MVPGDKILMTELYLAASCFSLKSPHRILPTGSLPSGQRHSQGFPPQFQSQIGISGKGEDTERK